MLKCFREHAGPLSSVGIINKVVKDVGGREPGTEGRPRSTRGVRRVVPSSARPREGLGHTDPKVAWARPRWRGCDTGRDDREGQARRGVPQTPTQKQFAELPW